MVRCHNLTLHARACLATHTVEISLYEQDGVVREWEDFLEGIVSVPRPAHTEQRRLHRRHERRYGGLAVDASDFPAKLSWCSRFDSPQWSTR